MADKTIIQRAQGYSNQPVTVTVQINGTIILQGEIPTIDTPPPSLPDLQSPDLGANAWSWSLDSSFTGSQTMTITVDNGEMYLCDTLFTLSNRPGNVYHLPFWQQQGDLQFNDPLTGVTINDVPQTPTRDPDLVGQWLWRLVAGDEFACNVNIINQNS